MRNKVGQFKKTYLYKTKQDSAWCKSGTGTRNPPQSLKMGHGTPRKFKSGTPGPPSKFKSGTPGPPTKFNEFFNEFFFFRIFLCLF